MTREERELQDARNELLKHLWLVFDQFQDRLSIPEVNTIRTLYNFIVLTRDNLELLDKLNKGGDSE